MTQGTSKTLPYISTLFAATVLVALPACKTTRYNVATTAPTYAADANIKIKPNKTDNGEIFIDVELLTPPKRIGKANAG